MVVKDRLQELKTLMKEEDKDEVENITKEMPTTLISFFEHVRGVKVEVQELKNKINDLKTLIANNQHWTDSEIRRELKSAIEKEKFLIGNSAKSIRNNLVEMKKTPYDGKRTSIIQRIKDVQLNAIINDLNEIIREYLNCLVQERERSVKILKDMLEVKGENVTNIDSLLEEGKISIFTNNLLIKEMEEKYELREPEEKYQEIIKIESSILEIRNLFNELALIIDVQGEKIDEFEKLVEKNLDKVEKSDKLLASASKTRRKVACRKIMIALICSGVIIIVLLLLSMT